MYLYGTYFGGATSSQGTIANAIALDHLGDIYIGGSTKATDLPAVQAVQSSCTISFNTCGFLTELNPAASGASEIVFSTYLGEGTSVSALATDGATPPNLYAAGTANLGVLGASVPVTPGAFETAPGFGLETPGVTPFVAKIPTGTPASPVYITYLGGSNQDTPAAIAVDASGDAWIGGKASSWDFPTLNSIIPCPSGNDSTNCNAGFVSELNPAGTALLFSTFIGGNSGSDLVSGIAPDSTGNAYAAGITESTNFPVTSGAFQSACQPNGLGGCQTFSAFVAKLAPQTAPTAPAVAISSPGFTQGFVNFENTAIITVTNTAAGGPDLTVTGVASDGQPNFDFSADATRAGAGTGNPACMANSTTPNPVPPGGSCDITVFWDPEQTVPDTGTVEIFDNAANLASPQPVFLSGNGITGAQATVAPSPVNFGDVLQGQGRVETITVTSTGNQSLTINSFGLSGASDFALGQQSINVCTNGESLSRAFGPTSPGGSCTITVIYNGSGALNVPETAA
ncbi:MAG: SBBP repeat-containing protein, partial [Terriglobales bacterium]